MYIIVIALILDVYIIKSIRDKINSYGRNRLQHIYDRVIANEEKVADIVLEISNMNDMARFYYDCVKDEKDKKEIKKFIRLCDKYLKKFLTTGIIWVMLSDYVSKGLNICSEDEKVCPSLSIKRIFNKTYRRCKRYAKKMVIIKESMSKLNSKYEHFYLLEDKRCG